MSNFAFRWAHHALILPLLFLIGGCVSTPNIPSKSACEFSHNGSKLKIEGELNDAVLDCIESGATTSLKRVDVFSQGGRPGVSMKIADTLSKYDINLTVDTLCASSCANYLVPIAKSLQLSEGSAIILHGSIDAATLAKSLELAKTEEIRQRNQDVYRQQSNFAREHNVSKGWLLYRESEERSTGSFGKFVVGNSKDLKSSEPVVAKYLIVTEPFLRSCLSSVQILPFENTLPQMATRSSRMRRSLARSGYSLTEGIKCMAQIPNSDFDS